MQDGDRFVFDRDLRRSVIFGRHDLIEDAPISRTLLLICRNSLMYFNAEAQQRILARFHFALADGGVQFLGKAEMLLTQSQLFQAIDQRRRIFRKVSRGGWRERMLMLSQGTVDEARPPEWSQANLYSSAVDATPVAQIVIDAEGLVAFFNQRARGWFDLMPADVGRPFQDLELSYRPADLRTLIEQAVQLRREVSLKDLDWSSRASASRHFDVSVTPLLDSQSRTFGVSLAFVDVSALRHLQVHRAEDMWGLRADEVRGQSLLALDIGLPTDRLRQVIRASLNGDSGSWDIVLPATNRRGRSIDCQITGTPLHGSDHG